MIDGRSSSPSHRCVSACIFHHLVEVEVSQEVTLLGPKVEDKVSRITSAASLVKIEEERISTFPFLFSVRKKSFREVLN